MRRLLFGFIFFSFLFCFVAWTMYKLANSVSVTDPAKQAALAGEVAPGARPPTGFDTGTAFTMGMRGITYHEKQGKRALILMESPLPKNKPADALADYRARQDAKSHVVVDKQERLDLNTKSGSLPVLARQIHLPDGTANSDFLVLAQNPKRSDKILIIIGNAPGADEGKFLAEFLANLEVSAWP
ncbi:hypothetical protein JST97_12115 [bacterium]|nr:hypothetical protein [bacterium]